MQTHLGTVEIAETHSGNYMLIPHIYPEAEDVLFSVRLRLDYNANIPEKPSKKFSKKELIRKNKEYFGELFKFTEKTWLRFRFIPKAGLLELLWGYGEAFCDVKLNRPLKIFENESHKVLLTTLHHADYILKDYEKPANPRTVGSN